MDLFSFISFMVSIPSYIVDIVQLLGWISTYFKSKKKAKGTSIKANAKKHKEV